MTLFNWSPNTFHTIWNANNCDYYVLRKDLNKAGNSPYVLEVNDDDALSSALSTKTTKNTSKIGGMYPKSSINVIVEFSNSNGQDSTKMLTLHNYLAIPPPRTTRLNLIKELLKEQYPDIIHDVEDIVSVTIAPVGGTITASSSSSLLTKSDTENIAAATTSKSAPDLRRLGSRIIKQIELSMLNEKHNKAQCQCQRPRLDEFRGTQLETSTRFPHLSTTTATACCFSSCTATTAATKTATLLDNLEQDPKEWRIA